MGSSNREPQEYSRNIMEHKDPGRYIPMVFLLYFWTSLVGVPTRVPLTRVFLFRLEGLRWQVRLKILGLGFWVLVGLWVVLDL